MRMRWRLVLPLWGVILFALLTYHAVQWNRETRQGHSSRYFWWGATRLNSDPMNKNPRIPIPCEQGTDDCISFDPEYISVEPGLMQIALVLSALPGFLSSLAVVRGLARLGVSELVSFMLTTPIFIFAWFYAVGWFLDRWRYKRSVRTAATDP